MCCTRDIFSNALIFILVLKVILFIHSYQTFI